MDIFLFVSELGLSAFTSDPAGSNLPDMYAPWQPDPDWHGRLIHEIGTVVASAVEERGFFLISTNRSRRKATGRDAEG